MEQISVTDVYEANEVLEIFSFYTSGDFIWFTKKHDVLICSQLAYKCKFTSLSVGCDIRDIEIIGEPAYIMPYDSLESFGSACRSHPRLNPSLLEIVMERVKKIPVFIQGKQTFIYTYKVNNRVMRLAFEGGTYVWSCKNDLIKSGDSISGANFLFAFEHGKAFRNAEDFLIANIEHSYT